MSLSTHGIFETLVIIHIITGTVGLISVWIPIAGKKGGGCTAKQALFLLSAC